MIHTLSDDCKNDLEKCGNIRNFYRSVLSGNRKQEYTIKCDKILSDHLSTLIRKRSTIEVAGKIIGEKERDCYIIDSDAKQVDECEIFMEKSENKL